jgi:hypothetical protein
MLDVLKAVPVVMIESQHLYTPMWKIYLWMPKLLTHLESMDLTMGHGMILLKDVLESINQYPETPTYHNVSLKEEWVIQSTALVAEVAMPSHRSKPAVLLNWMERSPETCNVEQQQFITDVSNSLHSHFKKCTQGWLELAMVLTCMDFDLLVDVLCAEGADALDDGSITAHKVTDFFIFLNMSASYPT